MMAVPGVETPFRQSLRDGLSFRQGMHQKDAQRPGGTADNSPVIYRGVLCVRHPVV